MLRIKNRVCSWLNSKLGISTKDFLICSLVLSVCSGIAGYTVKGYYSANGGIVETFKRMHYWPNAPDTLHAYGQDYIALSRLQKAQHEIDILREALISEVPVKSTRVPYVAAKPDNTASSEESALASIISNAPKTDLTLEDIAALGIAKDL